MSRPGGAGRREPGLATIAALANVSMMTVSRVLNGTGRISEATRARVMGIVEQIGYVPNLAARSLVSNESRIVAAVVPSISNSMYADTLHGMSDVLRDAGYFLAVAHTGYSRREEFEVVKALMGQRPCGVFLHNTLHRPETVELLRRQRAPVFETGDLTSRPIESVVSFSNRDAGMAMTRHLLHKGYRRIAFASAPRRINERVQQRRRGYHDALREAGLRPDPAMEFEADPEPVAGARLLPRILRSLPEVDAIFFASERLSIGAFFEAQRLGIAVPGRVAIAGFDHHEMTSQVFPSGITTIATPRREIGECAARQLLARLRDPAIGPCVIDLGFELTESGST